MVRPTPSANPSCPILLRLCPLGSLLRSSGLRHCKDGRHRRSTRLGVDLPAGRHRDCYHWRRVLLHHARHTRPLRQMAHGRRDALLRHPEHDQGRRQSDIRASRQVQVVVPDRSRHRLQGVPASLDLVHCLCLRIRYEVSHHLLRRDHITNTSQVSNSPCPRSQNQWATPPPKPNS
jgi:hypothetical protein